MFQIHWMSQGQWALSWEDVLVALLTYEQTSFQNSVVLDADQTSIEKSSPQ